MNPWTTKKTATVIAFYILNFAIALIAVVMLLEIWELLDPHVRNKILATVGVCVAAGMCIAVTNFVFSAAEEDPPSPKNRQNSRLGESLRDAKLKSED